MLLEDSTLTIRFGADVEFSPCSDQFQWNRLPLMPFSLNEAENTARR